MLDQSVNEKLSLCLDKWTKVKKRRKTKITDINELCGSIESLGKNSAALLPEEEENKWIKNSDDDDDMDIADVKKEIDESMH